MKKSIITLICTLIMFAVFFDNALPENIVFATKNVEITETYDNKTQKENEKGLFVTLSLTLSGGLDIVTITASHDFSLFSSVVIVYLYLYNSVTLQTSYNNMNLVASSYTADLDLGQQLQVYAETGGAQKWWMGRMRYKIGNGDGEEKTIGPSLYDSNGNYITT